jgi:hypothetical protein
MEHSAWQAPFGRGTRLVVLLCAGLGGCENTPPAPLAPDAGQVVLRLAELRRQHQYRELAASLVPERATNVVDLLMAADEFLIANEQLCRWLRERVGMGTAQTIDQSYLADDLGTYAGEGLGLFGRQFELLNVVADDATATVTFAAGERVLAQTARLRKIGGRWRLDPGTAKTTELAAAFRELGHALDSVRTDLQGGKLSTETIHQEPERLVELVKARLRRGVNLLSAARPDS